MTKKNPTERELLEAENISYIQLKDVPLGARTPFLTTFTRVAPGALPNGTRVKKINSQPPDATQDGMLGTIEGSIGPVVVEGPFKDQYGYFVRWDHRKDLQVFITSTRVEEVVQ